MKLIAIIGNRQHALDVPQDMLESAAEFFQKMDRDMDGGWRMGPEFIEHPDPVQRVQIVADRLLGALSSANETLALLMAGYILTRMPGVRAVRIDTDGEPLNTEILRDRAAAPAAPAGASAKPLNRLEAMTQAGKDVSPVYRAGRGFRYAVYDSASGGWTESALMDDENEANNQRLQAVKRRFDELTGA